MYYVYVLKSQKDSGLYIGYTKDLRKRFQQHNNGHSKSTKARSPFTLIYYESFVNNADALAREKFLKSGYGRKQLLEILKHTFKVEKYT